MSRPDRTHPLRDIYEPAEDTHLLMGVLHVSPGQRALEVGTGSGAVAVHLAKRGARVLATDINPEAVAHARGVARGEGADVEFLVGDLVAPLCGRFDLVVFNPPYLPTGPEDRLEGPLNLALDGGPDGLVVVRRFLQALPAVVAPGGSAFVVVSTLSPWEAFDAAVPPGWSARVVAADRFDFEEIRVVELKPPGGRPSIRRGGSRSPRGPRRARGGTPRATRSGPRTARRPTRKGAARRRRGPAPRNP